MIHEYLDKTQLEEIHRIYENAPRTGYKKAEFKSKILSRFKIEISDEDYETLLTKLDFDKNDLVTWDEFVSYLVLELECKGRDARESVNIENPIVDEPEIINSRHRSGIIHIMFTPSVDLNGAVDYSDGKYMSMSKDGLLNVWSLDFKLLRTYRDKSLNSVVKSTWVTNFVCLSDLNVLVTSSTERELRFYDITSKRFSLIIVFVSMPFCINHMFYHFSESAEDESILVCGDLGGNVRVMQFPKEDKGPFKQKIGVEKLILSWDQVVRGKLPLMKAYNILKVHSDWVMQVSYYKLLGSIVSCSTSPKAMFMGDFCGSKTSYQFYLKRGIETFCVNEDSPLIVTGSLDCILRLWNPFITTKPTSLLRGHHASIVKIFLQDQGRRIYSLDRNRVLKVWERSSQTCIQTYSGFAFESGPIKEFSAYYNSTNNLFIVGGFKIASTICGRLVDELSSDGKTHCGPVSVVLFNRLFRCVITCGLDSNIVIWNPWTNTSMACIRNAHFSVSLGVHLPLPITAATLDSLHQYLLTGSSDGSIKIWDFNMGLCLRNMSLGKGREVTRLIWLTNRILAVGENCRVVQFGDSLGGKISAGKEWELRHTSEITSADFSPPSQPAGASSFLHIPNSDWHTLDEDPWVILSDLIPSLLMARSDMEADNRIRSPCTVCVMLVSCTWRLRGSLTKASVFSKKPGQALATGTYDGDLIFWHLETGQSYKRYNVTHPTGLLRLEYLREKSEKKWKAPGVGSAHSSRKSSRARKEKKENQSSSPNQSRLRHRRTFGVKGLEVPKKVLLMEKMKPSVERNLTIHCMIFLKKREMLPDQATLLIATENGMIQAWSHHPSGNFIMAFRAVHICRDYVVSMFSDPDNEFLFTGTVRGYIKIWLMKNYCLSGNAKVKVCMPLYRLQFPFLIKDRIQTRVKAALKNQPSPLLLSSYKGHNGAILSLEYVQECKILLTASADKTVRIWTLSGRYIGCLGQTKPWLNLEWGMDAEKMNAESKFRIPPDIVQNASYTTLKVLRGAPPIAKKKYNVEEDVTVSEEERRLGVYGKRLAPPTLGQNHYFPPKLSKKKRLPPLDETLMKIPTFTHLVMSPLKPLPKFPVPQCIQDIKANPEERSGSTFQD